LLVPGYISPFKGDDVIINAIGRIKNNFKLIFMGKVVNRKYYRYLKNLILRNNLEGKVEFTGFVDDKRFVEEFNKAYVVIVPRLISPWLKKKLEYKLRKIINLEYHIELSSSGVLTSAFALGKTVVCSKNKGYSEYVNPKRGVMCDNDVYSWENAIRYLLENPDVVKKMSANALEFANNEISVEKIATKHIKVYEKVLGNV
jgi:glycosyltransferase involved in cell wall biosynthesis